MQEKSLQHSRLLIPALMRVARLYGLPSYRGRERIETADISYNPFFKDKCALEHLRAYPEILVLFEQVRLIEQKNADFIPELGEILGGLIDRTVEKLKTQFGENALHPRIAIVSVAPQNIILDEIALASGIIDQIQSKNPLDIRIWRVCALGACERCNAPGADHSLCLTNAMYFGEDAKIAEGDLDFLEEVRKFVAIEVKDESNIAAVAKIETLRSEYSQTISSLRTLVSKLIFDIESGVPLKGECSICSRSIASK